MSTENRPVTELSNEQLTDLSVKHLRDANAIVERYRASGTDYTGMSDEDKNQVKTLLSAVDTLEAEKTRRNEDDGLRLKMARYLMNDERDRPPVAAALPFGWQSAGPSDAAAQFTNSENYRRLKESGELERPSAGNQFSVNLKDYNWITEIRRKALLYTGSAVGGSFVIPEYLPGFQGTAKQRPDILDLVPRAATTTDTIYWVRQDTWTQGGAITAEASNSTGTSGTKPESALAFSRQSTSVKTIAVWIPVTNQMLADAPQIEGVIRNHLMLDLELELDDEVLSGSGSGDHFNGLLTAAGNTIAASASNNKADAILRGITTVQTSDYRDPDGIVMHPNDWEEIRLLRELGTSGMYLMGPPSVTGPNTLWGRTVAITVRQTQNTALVGAFQAGCMLFDREQSSVKVGYINDQFTRNMQTLLAELRAAFVVFRPNAFAKVTGV